MRQIPSYSLIALLVATPLFLSSCSSSDDEEGANGETHVSAISGVAQKGQFLRGSSITIYALDKTLNASGLSYPTQTTDDLGSFSVSNVNADFIDVKANGYYYNENKRETSKSTINLQALAETSSNVNVNLLTTLAYNRIKHLVAAGSKFSDAQSRAQIEVLTALGLGNSTTANFTEMNIAGSGDANGLLLAASLLIQQDRNVGDVSKLISDIASDLEEDGLLSDDLNQEIHKKERYIYVGEVINGLIEFYEKNKVENFNIPTFYKFLDTDGDGKMDGTAEYIFKCIDPADVMPANLDEINRGHNAEGFSLTKSFLSTIPFKVESDAAWITVSKRRIAENVYAVDIVGQPNTGENRTAYVMFTDNSGNELAKYTYQQKAPDEFVPQRLAFRRTLQMEHRVPDKIGVNGKLYGVNMITDPYNTIWFGYGYGGYWYVDIPYTDKADNYQLYFPTNMISMPDGYGTFKLTIPSTFTSDEFPFISQRENSDYSPIGNPAQIQLVNAAPAVNLNVIQASSIYQGHENYVIIGTGEGGEIYYHLDIDQTYDHVVLTSEEPICGSATYYICEGEVDKYTAPVIEAGTHPDGDGLYRITVQIIHHESASDILVPVLRKGIPVHVQYYDIYGQIIHESDTRSSYYSGSGQTR